MLALMHTLLRVCGDLHLVCILQITDISQFGTPQEVASLVLPRDVRLLGTAVTKTPLPPKDTGTVLGVVDRDPITTYRCSCRVLFSKVYLE